MSTRGCIARLQGDLNFKGVYHHWDSYPTALGKTLWELYHGFFKQDLELMLKTLIDNHPAGWSTINDKDFNLKAGFIEHSHGDSKQPECYCHGDRHEEAQEVTDKNASGMGCEYAYVFNSHNRMAICSSYTMITGKTEKMIGFFGMGDPDAKWRPIAVIDLNGEEPDWELIGKEEE
jgi:hypothetical protein